MLPNSCLIPGAGKSTLIKLIIDLNTQSHQYFSTPVIGTVGLDVPTSADVHLYSDPQTADSDHPILFADCEGLEGGERVPLGSRSRKWEKKSRYKDEHNQLQPTSERQITWADNVTKRSREYTVTHLYPRLLYTFSNVVVFVLKNARYAEFGNICLHVIGADLSSRVVEGVFEKLIDWAAAALEKSSNQPVLPHAIIVLNASENDIDSKLWDVETATATMLDSVSRTVFRKPTFKKYAQFWRERNKVIESVEQLIHAYYSSIRIVRIPTNGRPNLIQSQVQCLQEIITNDCSDANKTRANLRMLMNAEEIQPYLQFAFDHFACDLETPFDFVQASFTNSPIPLDFGGNILKLALSLMETWRNKIDGEIIFKELSYMVASCIMLDSARSKIRGVDLLEAENEVAGC